MAKTPSTITVHGMTFDVIRKSKWTVEAWANSEKCASDKSVPKLKAKLEEKFAPVEAPKEEEEEPPIVDVMDEEPITNPIHQTLDDLHNSKTSKEKAEKPKGAKKPKKGRVTIKAIVLDLILQGADDDQIIERVKEEIPDSKINKSHTSWYRSTFVRDGVLDPIYAPKQSRVYKTALKALEKEAEDLPTEH